MIAIRTPDQRLRIFVSSTMKELAGARVAARTGIERLERWDSSACFRGREYWRGIDWSPP